MALNEQVRAARTLIDVYRYAARTYGDRPALCPRLPDGTYGSISHKGFFETGLCLATALIELGVEAREHVAILADNRLEWAVTDCAVLCAGAADVPRGTDVTPAEIDYIINHADVRVVFVEHAAMLEKFHKCRSRVPGVTHVIVMARDEPLNFGALGLWDLVERGRALRARGDRRAEVRMDAVTPDDLFTLIYTSGTTGRPKGVQLTHANMVSQIRNLPIEFGTSDRLLSILPVWHSYERVGLMFSIAFGGPTYYTSVRTIAQDLRTVRPTLLLSAPRLWENLYQKIIHNVHQQSRLKRAMFRVAYFFSRRLRHSAYFIEGRRIDLVGRSPLRSFVEGCGHAVIYAVLLAPYLVMDGLVTRKLRAILGGAFRGTVSGGGALPPHVDEFFNYIGIPVLEGYGLTETCPVLAVRTWKKRVIGTVGPPWPETEVRIVDLDTHEVLFPDPKRKGGGRGLRGEIHVRGPQVMKGYYKDPELTARVLRDGWLATGDIGVMTYNDCLRIVGRCKETIVLLSGENVEPLPIENKLTESPYIDQCIVVGQDQKHLAALIVTRPENFVDDGIRIDDPAQLPAHPEVRRIIAREIKALVNARTGFRPFEMIHGWRIVPKPFEPGDELTSTYKLKRHVIDAKYSALIAEIYAGANQRTSSSL
ncbi:MAG: long-chain fatty acid--CoA ligase [Verrucomicrobia bacterium]|nr:MAG: long-chain fatty acid--CoA ligase [Verrucomicrobiota bacterium]